MSRHVRRLLILVAGMALMAAPAVAASGPGAFTTRGAWSFVSAPSLHPPKLLTLGKPDTAKLAVGDFLLDTLPSQVVPGPMTGQGGPLIVNQKLQPVWLAPMGANTVSGDLQQETYDGQPVLVWWQGQLTATGAATRGEVVVVDQHYRRLATLKAHSPWVISLHDAVISGGDIWVTVYRDVPHQNLVAYGGHRNSTVYDAGFQEYDLRTGKLLYTWDALNPGHKANVPLAASEQPASAPGAAWDAYHVNSIQVLGPTTVLVSMRNTWAAYLINTTTGTIEWTLGGKHSTFKFGPGASFAWQHDVRFISTDEVTLFDDSCCRITAKGGFAPNNGPSRGMILRVNFARRTVSLVKADSHTPRLDTGFLGSMQLLPGGGSVVGWGSLPYFSEYSASGQQLLDVRFPGKDESYRALWTSTWAGTPYYPPSGAARQSHGRTTVYASWNGDTQVGRWQVLAGPSRSQLKPVASAAKSGFETAISVKGSYRVFEVAALGGHGMALARSRAFR
ncbi:MAG TPA: arylsulfotransferase family protein [Solirubrobacteraceae bacterium]|nr:arylsulfotransferase family protein [Solirubrobacteraceae bacterium]